MMFVIRPSAPRFNLPLLGWFCRVSGLETQGLVVDSRQGCTPYDPVVHTHELCTHSRRLWRPLLQIYMAPGAQLDVSGFVSSVSFLRGVLDNIGVDPVVVRIGDYKSVGWVQTDYWDSINLPSTRMPGPHAFVS
jgi:hypothetical protein